MSSATDDVLPLPAKLGFPLVEIDGKGRPKYPPIPDENDQTALRRWLTVAST